MVGVENMFPLKLRGDRGVRFHSSQDLDDLDRFPHLVLDTSHLAVAGIDLIEAYERYRDKVLHFHLSNNAGRGWDSHLPVDVGVLPLDRLLRAIVGDGFAGAIAIELDLRSYIQDPDEVHAVLVRNREFCESILAARA
jgi:sugar phosphate isomerase/epimerase